VRVHKLRYDSYCYNSCCIALISYQIIVMSHNMKEFIFQDTTAIHRVHACAQNVDNEE
jgi:hypothetical protein